MCLVYYQRCYELCYLHRIGVIATYFTSPDIAEERDTKLMTDIEIRCIPMSPMCISSERKVNSGKVYEVIEIRREGCTVFKKEVYTISATKGNT